MIPQLEELTKIYNPDGIFGYTWLIIISIFARVASDMKQIHTGQKRFSITVFCFGLITSCFVSILAFHACVFFDIDANLMIIIVGMASYSGTEGIHVLIKILSGRYNLNLKLETKENIKDERND